MNEQMKRFIIILFVAILFAFFAGWTVGYWNMQHIQHKQLQVNPKFAGLIEINEAELQKEIRKSARDEFIKAVTWAIQNNLIIVNSNALEQLSEKSTNNINDIYEIKETNETNEYCEAEKRIQANLECMPVLSFFPSKYLLTPPTNL